VLANLGGEHSSKQIAYILQSEQVFDTIKTQAAIVGALLNPHPESLVQVDMGVVKVKSASRCMRTR